MMKKPITARGEQIAERHKPAGQEQVHHEPGADDGVELREVAAADGLGAEDRDRDRNRDRRETAYSSSPG